MGCCVAKPDVIEDIEMADMDEYQRNMTIRMKDIDIEVIDIYDLDTSGNDAIM